MVEIDRKKLIAESAKKLAAKKEPARYKIEPVSQVSNRFIYAGPFKPGGLIEGLEIIKLAPVRPGNAHRIRWIVRCSKGHESTMAETSLRNGYCKCWFCSTYQGRAVIYRKHLSKQKREQLGWNEHLHLAKKKKTAQGSQLKNTKYWNE